MSAQAALPSRILVVDDDSRLRELLVSFLGSHQMHVSGVPDAETMLSSLQQTCFDLYILDINLPGMSGWDLCRHLRDHGDNTPIIMLTARSEDHDRIHGLELGADDYLPKPFNSHELLARIRAVLRRFDLRLRPATIVDESIAFDDFMLDPARNQLMHRGQPVLMTATELLLFKLLYQHRGRAISRNLICQSLHGRDHLPDDRSVDVLISRVRKHLGLRQDGAPYIQTIRNQGYMLLTPNTDSPLPT